MAPHAHEVGENRSQCSMARRAPAVTATEMVERRKASADALPVAASTPDRSHSRAAAGVSQVKDSASSRCHEVERGAASGVVAGGPARTTDRPNPLHRPGDEGEGARPAGHQACRNAGGVLDEIAGEGQFEAGDPGLGRQQAVELIPGLGVCRRSRIGPHHELRRDRLAHRAATASANQRVSVAGWVMAVPTTTAAAPRRMASAAWAGVWINPPRRPDAARGPPRRRRTPSRAPRSSDARRCSRPGSSRGCRRRPPGRPRRPRASRSRP